MADTDEDKQKKAGQNQGPSTAAKEAFEPEAKKRDPDEAVFAEQAIRSFATQRLDDWQREMDGALDQLDGYLLSQGGDVRVNFDQRGYLESLGQFFLEQLYGIAGGRGTPVMDAIAGEVGGVLAFAERTSGDCLTFVSYLRRGVRDASWYLRDNLPAILSAQWPQLLDLAYEGYTSFIPALYSMGMPSIRFDASAFGRGLLDHADAYKRTLGPQKEQAVEQARTEAKKEEAKQAAQDLAFDDEAKKQAAAATA